VHVAHAIIDGVIDIPRTKEWLKDMPAEAKLSADAVSFFFPSLFQGDVERLMRGLGWGCVLMGVADCE
jgi:hypothetical protein